MRYFIKGSKNQVNFIMEFLNIYSFTHFEVNKLNFITPSIVNVLFKYFRSDKIELINLKMVE